MEALGQVETRGLIGAIEAADVMLKTAPVALLDRVFVGGGLVTVCVTGNVAAVTAAVEAGAAAVSGINGAVLLSTQILPRPDSALEILFPAPQPPAVEPQLAVQSEPEPMPDVKVIALTELNKQAVDRYIREHGSEMLFNALAAVPVVKLRRLLRDYPLQNATGRTISKANKQWLLERLDLYYQTDSD